MKKLIKATPQECIAIAGGRDEIIALFVETVAQCIGAFARIVYLLTTKKKPIAAFRGYAG